MTHLTAGWASGIAAGVQIMCTSMSHLLRAFWYRCRSRTSADDEAARMHIHLAREQWTLESAINILACFAGGVTISLLPPMGAGILTTIVVSVTVTKLASASAGYLNKLLMPWWDWVKSYWRRKPLPVTGVAWHHPNPRILDMINTEVTDDLLCGITYEMV